MKTKTLYVSDLDGTLLSTDSRISARSAETISRLTSEGALITVATARTPATVVPLLGQTGITPPAVVMTGCALWQREEGRFMRPHFVPEGDLRGALDFCRTHGVHPFVYVMAPDGATLDVYHAAPRLNRPEEAFYLERRGLTLKRFHLGQGAPERAADYSMLLFAMGDEKPIRAAFEAFRNTSECASYCYPDVFNPHVWNFEVFPPRISKAMAVQQLKKELGCERLVAFGDSLNDLPLLAVADEAVAVGNALPEVKAAATTIIEPNYTDSVARFIEEDFGGRG